MEPYLRFDLDVALPEWEWWLNAGLDAFLGFDVEVLDLDIFNYNKTFPLFETTLATDRSNRAPGAPYNPSPVDGASDVSLSPSLSWEASDPEGDPLTFDVYFGATDAPLLIRSELEETSYKTGFLSEHTTYYWKVVARIIMGIRPKALSGSSRQVRAAQAARRSRTQ